MILSQILQPSCIKAPLKGRDTKAVITELVDLLAQSEQLINRDIVLESVLIREKTRSTGIGSGIAIPHGKCNGVKELVMAIGIAPQPIDFKSIDNKGVSIIILLASPIDQTGPHIQALARISRIMLDESFRLKLKNAASPQEVFEMINSKDSQ